MSVENRRLHTALISGSAAHKKCSMQQFQKLDLTTGQPKVLSILSQKEGYLQKDLAVRCHVEPATMTCILSNMISKGLIYKKTESVSGGKRAYAIYLTEDGHNMSRKVNEIIDDVEIISFQGFAENEKQLLIDLLNRIQSNLERNN
jgi:DNA-binding MarR family transcriptional regulator